MSDGHGPTPETPPGWAAEQPPPYGAPASSPWTAPGSGPAPQQQPQIPYGQQPPQAPPYQQGPPQQAPYQQQQPYGPQGYGYQPPPQALRPGIIPLRPLALGDILDGTIKLIRSNPKAVLGLSAIAAAMAAIPISIGQAVLFGSMGGLLSDPESAESQAGTLYSGLSSWGGILVSLAVSFVVVTLLTGVLTRILGRAVFGGKITAGEAWQLVKGRVPALFGLVALTSLILIVPMLVLGGLFVALAMGGMGEGAMVGLLILFYILFIAYALFVNARFAFAAPVVVLEGLSPVAALRRSWRLVSGDFWRVLGIMLLTQLLAGLISGILTVPFTIAGVVVGMLGGGSFGSTVVTAVLLAVGTTLGYMITYPIQAGVAGLLYTDRRMRSEAFDLVLQTAAIEQQRQGWVHAAADDLWHPSNAARP